MIYKKENAIQVEKNGVNMRIYNSQPDCQQVALVYQETERGHFEEFLHEKSFFIYYIIEGNGSWFIDGEEHKVQSGDVVIIPPNKKIYYTGSLKQICITSPAWEPQFEKHIRDIDYSE